ncbi:alpha/beta hydrolase fold domain-containing protein [Glaciihabitans sp. UYNi722]|uniref:alpha/beta hydrolase n=1 Tax=Glaciihabitans sp. UYNi722 TaxID=3156344 RepID=UPI0033932BF4
MREYRPRYPQRARRLRLGEDLPILIWMHGGGFRSGNLDMNEAHLVASELAARTPAVVISVDYRLAGAGLHYPEPLDDVHSVWQWVAAGNAGAGAVAMGGASAGGNLATASVLRLTVNAGRVASALLLAYPVVHFPVPALPFEITQTIDRELPNMLRFSPETIEEMFLNHVGRITDLPVETVPGLGSLTGFPPTTLVISEFDDLRPSAELLVRQLEQAGVPVRRHLALAMEHGHLDLTLNIAEVDASLAVFVDALRQLRMS